MPNGHRARLWTRVVLTLLLFAPAPIVAARPSLAPWLANPDLKTDRAVLTTLDPGNHALTTRDWRYLRYANGNEELYDTAHDPHEWTNLAKDESKHDKLAEMRMRMDETLAKIVPEKP